VHLSRGLDLRIVIEGVENREQLALLSKHHCADLIQGYVFSMPVSTTAIVELSRDVNGRKGKDDAVVA
jgi:EAL domain-containing protein (putative c-di-GMP-specific phosphodiesterase class I)